MTIAEHVVNVVVCENEVVLANTCPLWLVGGASEDNLTFNPLIPELNPICYLLALLGAYHFLRVSRIRVKLLTYRRLMSYIYIYIWSTHS